MTEAKVLVLKFGDNRRFLILSRLLGYSGGMKNLAQATLLSETR